jgi:hypothetical protein
MAIAIIFRTVIVDPNPFETSILPRGMGSICYATYEEPIPHPSHQKKNPLDNPRDST